MPRIPCPTPYPADVEAALLATSTALRAGHAYSRACDAYRAGGPGAYQAFRAAWQTHRANAGAMGRANEMLSAAKAQHGIDFGWTVEAMQVAA